MLTLPPNHSDVWGGMWHRGFHAHAADSISQVLDVFGGGAWLNVNKKVGMTSNDVVGAVRRILRIPTVGHAGTLDPYASGVLPVAVGRTTKLFQVAGSYTP